MRRLWSLLTLVLLASLVLSACTAGSPPNPAAPAGNTSADSDESASSQEVQDFVTWYQYDQNNEDPASDERVGNQYLRDTIPLFNEEFAGRWNWINQPKAWDQMVTELVAAVQSGGEIPDLMHIGADHMPTFHRNGTVQDLSEWAQEQSWYEDLAPNAIEACTGPNGALYCIPVSQQPHLVFAWSDRFPDGYPTTPEEFLERAAELKEEGLYVITFFGSTDFNGEGTTRFVWMAVSSFGGTFDDGQGNMLLNTPENVEAIEFMREIVANGYAPEIVFAGQWQEEEAFKDASAASFPTGLFGYHYVNPLTAPDGTAYDKGNEEDMIDAIEAGDVMLAPFVAPEGHVPGCNATVGAFVIPNGAENVEAAQDYINWIMSPEQNPAWVLAPGGGFPVRQSIQASDEFQSTFYQQAAEVADASECSPWSGSLERQQEAQRLIMNAVYRLIKEDPTADIEAELTATQEEYNAGG